MERLNYLGYQIYYYPKDSESSVTNLLEDVATQVKILKDSKEITALTFIIPWQSYATSKSKTQEVIDLAINKVKEIIDQGLENNQFQEFEFLNSEFEGVVDVTQ